MGRAGGLLAGVGVVLAFAFVAVQIGLFIGGISYRKDCVGGDGTVKSSWAFTWFAPVPYVFRPSEAGCQIHTGTRVALNGIGVAGFTKPTTISLAKKVSSDQSNPNLAYFGQMKGYLVDYQQRSASVTSIAEGQRLLDQFTGEVQSLSPTQKYSGVQARLLALFSATKRYGEEMQAAVAASDKKAYLAAAERVKGQEADMTAVLKEFNRLHSTD